MNFSRLVEDIIREKVDVRKLHGNYRTQLHLSREKKIEFEIVDTVIASISHNKPSEGLWTSTMFKTKEGKASSSWWEFFKRKPFNIIDFDYVHLMTVQGNPKKLEIDSILRSKEVSMEYGEDSTKGKRYIDWKEVKKDYDCVHVYSSALNSPLFQRWDVESTVWFDPTFLKKELTWKIDNE